MAEGEKEKWKLGRLMQDIGVRELYIFAKQIKLKMFTKQLFKEQTQKDLFHMIHQGKIQKALIKKKSH